MVLNTGLFIVRGLGQVISVVKDEGRTRQIAATTSQITSLKPNEIADEKQAASFVLSRVVCFKRDVYLL